MWLKLAVLLVVLGLFAGAIFAIHRANRPARPGHRPEGPPLDDQMATLARAGLLLSPGVTRDDIVNFGPEETYRGDPWRLLLLTYAIPVDRPPHPPYCPRACLVQTDGFDSLEDYGRVIADLARAAGAPCKVDLSDGLTVRIGSAARTLKPRIADGAADTAVLRTVLDDLGDRMPDGERFFTLDMYPQIAFFRLDDAGFGIIDEAAPGLLQPDPMA